MLSVLIRSRLSYPAVLLAEQPVHQRSVHPGPLVKLSYISISSDYIFILSPDWGQRSRRIMATMRHLFRDFHPKKVVTGTNISHFYDLLQIRF